MTYGSTTCSGGSLVSVAQPFRRADIKKVATDSAGSMDLAGTKRFRIVSESARGGNRGVKD